MPAQIEIKKVEPRQFIGVRRTVKQEAIGPLCAEVLPRLYHWVSENGGKLGSPPATVYHSVDQDAGDYDLQPGFFVEAPLELEPDVTVFETAGGEALFAVHVGPYETIGETWHAMFAKAGELGRAVTKASWEIYIDDPEEVEPAQLRTEIYVPID